MKEYKLIMMTTKFLTGTIIRGQGQGLIKIFNIYCSWKTGVEYNYITVIYNNYHNQYRIKSLINPSNHYNVLNYVMNSVLFDQSFF